MGAHANLYFVLLDKGLITFSIGYTDICIILFPRNPKISLSAEINTPNLYFLKKLKLNEVTVLPPSSVLNCYKLHYIKY